MGVSAGKRLQRDVVEIVRITQSCGFETKSRVSRAPESSFVTVLLLVWNHWPEVVAWSEDLSSKSWS